MNGNTKSRDMSKVFNWLNLGAFLAMVVVNVLANALPLGGNTSAQVSDRYASLFTPTGMTFSIWGVIYVVLGIALIRRMLSKKEEDKALTEYIGGLFVVSCALNIGWIFSWHYGQITGATLLIFALLFTLIFIMLLVKNDKFLSIAFGLYTAWIAVASIASIFVQAAWNGYNLISTSGEIYTVIAIVFAGVIMTLITYTTGNWTFSAVGIWAFVGMIIRQVSQYHGDYNIASVAAIVMSTVMAIGLLMTFRWNTMSRWIRYNPDAVSD